MTHRLFTVPILILLAVGTSVALAATALTGGQATSLAAVDNASAFLEVPVIADQNTEQDADQDATFGADFIRSSGSFTITGDVQVVADDSGNQRLQLGEDFSTNGARGLVVALRSADGELRSLGPLTAATGQQDYALDEDTDFTVWDEVVIWNTEQDVAFGSAFLRPLS